MKKPLIGILANIETMDREPFLGQDKTSLQQNYIHSVIKAGGIPVVLPVITETAIIEQQIDHIDGLMLSGGHDIHPFHYGEQPHKDIGSVRPDRDFFEMTALKRAYAIQKPIFGICRGLQIINVTFGGTLYQDLSHKKSSKEIKHSQLAPIHVPWHHINVIDNTKLSAIVEKKHMGVNSFHHQSIKDIAPGFIASAYAEDGVIEAIEKIDYPFLLALQWHPERMADTSSEMLALFQAFVGACASLKQRVNV